MNSYETYIVRGKCIIAISIALFIVSVGLSMYPTLNANALDANGNLKGKNPKNPSSESGGRVDYGIMDTNAFTIDGLQRFNIVVTKFSDFDSSNYVKRIIALPGETYMFTKEGLLYINGEYVEQPIGEEYIKETYISYKSEKITEEYENADEAIKVLGGKYERQVEFMLPDSDIYRNLFIIKKIKNTPGKFPRKAGLPSKEPIQSRKINNNK